MSEVVSNDQELRRITHAAPSRRSLDEDYAWAQLYVAIGQACAAEEVVKQLDADPHFKRDHLALYIRAKTTLREQKIADARNQRIGSFVRGALTVLVVAPIRLLRDVLAISTGVAVEMLPPVRREPAKSRIAVLRSDPDFATAKNRFTAGADGAAPVAGDVGESRKAA